MNSHINKIIVEEVNGFDFLGNDKFLKEQDILNLLSEEDLQKQFICDSLLNRNNKIKIINYNDAFLGGNWDGAEFENIDKLTINYSLSIEYKYDEMKPPIPFNLSFNSDNIGVEVNGTSTGGDYLTQPSSDAWFNYINWNDVNVSLHSKNGDEIRFIALERAPESIEKLFIREYIESFIEGKTSIDVKEKFNKGLATEYC